jgi:twinkle protein
MIIAEKGTRKEFEITIKKSVGEEAMVCPKCSHERKKKTDKCFSWNHELNIGRCSHCETAFYLKKESEDKKVYVRPKFNNRTELSDTTVKYFAGRGISPQTLIDFKITEGLEYMPKSAKELNTLQFNYFRNGELINTKFRAKGKEFKLVADAELIMYNLDAIKDCDEVVITEGEIDAMSWHEVGIKNVVSVPNGASKNQKLAFLDNCFEYFENKKKIYLSTDSDEAGISLRDELARRLGYDKCLIIDFGEFKDTNEVLQSKESDYLVGLLKSAKDFPIEGVFTINDNWSEIENIYYNGLPKGDKTGDEQLDEHIGFMKGELTMITGIPSHGKSIYLDQISLGLSIESNWRFALCSPESYPMSFYYTRLIKRLTGKKFSKYSLTLEELGQAKEWVQDRYHLIMPKNGFNLDDILYTAKQLVLKKGINGLIIDPFNRIENTTPNGYNEGKWIVECLIKIITFAQTSGVHVFLVAHPTKMMKEPNGSNFVRPNLYNISGSAHFFNMTQNGMTVFRNYDTGKTEVHIQKVKWEHLGKIGAIEYIYDDETARFYPESKPKKGNWLDIKNYHEPLKEQTGNLGYLPNTDMDNDDYQF